jgi:ribosomal protein S18 acetylase RimI-like enzyme
MDWVFDDSKVDWSALSELYRIAPLGNKQPEHLKRVYSNSMFKCFALQDGVVIGAGRVLADGIDCAYLCDVVIHPDFQGQGVGQALCRKLMELSAGHDKIILYANPGKEGFYRKLGFRRMLTAMAKFQVDEDRALRRGLVEGDSVTRSAD